MAIETLGIDIAKNVFQLHGVDRNGRAILKRRVMRDELPRVIGPAGVFGPARHRHPEQRGTISSRSETSSPIMCRSTLQPRDRLRPGL